MAISMTLLGGAPASEQILFDMNAFPDEKDGLWGVVRGLPGTEIDIENLGNKYKNVERVVVRKE